MTLKDLRKFMEDRPNLSVHGLEQEAGIGQSTIWKAFSRNTELSKDTVEKLLPVLKKYGYKDKNK